MLFRCRECNEVFNEEEMKECTGDDFEYFGFTGKRNYLGCPKCEGDDFEEVHLCKGEHDYIPIDEDLCDECKVKIARSFKEFCRNLSEAERDYLLEELLGDDDYVKEL